MYFDRRSIIPLVLVYALLLSSLTACGGLKGKLVGVWSDGQSTMEFKDDGSLIVKTPLGDTNGYWKEVDSTHIDVQMSGFFSSFSSGSYEVSFKDDTVIVKAATGGGFMMRKFR